MIALKMIQKFETKNYRGMGETAKALLEIWKEYKVECKKLKISIDKDLKNDVNALGLILETDIYCNYCNCNK